MIKYFITLLLLKSSTLLFSQKSNEDSVYHLKFEVLADSANILAVINEGAKWVYTDVTRAIPYYLKAAEESQRIKYSYGHTVSLVLLGEAMGLSGNYSKALEISFKAVDEAAKSKSASLTNLAYLKIAGIHNWLGNYGEGIRFAKKITKLGIFEFAVLGEAYLKLNLIDSAKHYIEKANNPDSLKKYHWGLPYILFGDLHSSMRHYSLALEYYRLALAARPALLDSIDCQNKIAKLYKQTHQNDSAIWYSHLSLSSAERNGFQKELGVAYSILKDIYKNEQRLDSAFVYQELMLAVKDSIFATEKLNEIKIIQFDAQLKELDKLRAIEEAQKESINNLQYAAIAIGLVTLIIVYFLFSHSIIANQKLIKYLGIISLLLVFEFLNLLLHNPLGTITNHSPVLMLLALVVLAAMLAPLHHRMEHWITHQLVEKNKRIRLAAAKKTIASLEGGLN